MRRAGAPPLHRPSAKRRPHAAQRVRPLRYRACVPRRKPTGPRDPRRAGRPANAPGPGARGDAEAEQRRRAVCAAKVRYASEDEARAFALMHQPGPGARAQSYLCEVCGGWHHTRGAR